MSSSSLLRPVVSAVILGALVTGACATSPATPPPARAAELDRTMVELRAQNAGYVRQIDELQNRVFILQDKLDSKRSAGRSAAAAPASKHIGDGASPVGHAASEVVDESNGPMVEYAGEAALPAKRGRARPVLRLSGNSRPIVASTPPPAPPSPSPSPPSPAPESPPVIEAVTSESPPVYREALIALRAGHDAAALAGFRKFLVRAPHHSYADNAQYWIGECYYDLKQYKAAVREFRRVVERYSHGNKVPEAMLKIGLAQLATGDSREGRQQLESLRRMYPKHAASRLAAARLAQADEPARPATVAAEVSAK
jgi:tol-pal system protein YbgF